MMKKHEKMSKASIYYDQTGQIVSIVAAEAYSQGPPTGIVPPQDCRCYEINLSGEFAGIPILDIHTQYRIDLYRKKPRLVRLKKLPVIRKKLQAK